MASLDSSIDTLETAFSDSTRKLVRHIKVEWQRLSKCKSDLDAKENELLAAKERIAHLKEIETQNEKYLKSAQGRLENVKLSNAELRKKLNNLEKEEEKVIKNCSEQEEHMHKKITFYREKWRKRYEKYYSTDPRMIEKQKKIEELEELKEKLQALDKEHKKCEKELFEAKCNRNKSHYTEGSKTYPFNTFVVNIAQVYVETKKVYDECKIVSKNITDIENRIKFHKSTHQRAISNDSTLPPKNTGNIGKDFGQHIIDESSTFENDSLKLMNDKLKTLNESDFIKQNFRNIEHNVTNSRTDTGKNIKSASNELLFPDIASNHITINNTKSKLDDLQMKEKKSITMSRSVPKEQKVRKWLEKLKIFVPKFSSISEETGKLNDKDVAKVDDSENMETEESSKLELSSKKLKHALSDGSLKNDESLKAADEFHFMDSNSIFIAPVQHITTPAPKQVAEIDDIHSGTDRSMELSSNIGTSKYFRKSDANSDTSLKKTENVITEKGSVETNAAQDHMKLKVTGDAMIGHQKITNGMAKLYQETRRLDDSMDIDEELKKIEFGSLDQKINVDEIVATNAKSIIISVINKPNDGKEMIKSPLKYTEANLLLPVLNKYDTSNEYHEKASDASIDESRTEVIDDIQIGGHETDATLIVNVDSSLSDEKTEERQPLYLQNKCITQNSMDIDNVRENSTKTSVLNDTNTKTENHPNYQIRVFRKDTVTTMPEVSMDIDSEPENSTNTNIKAENRPNYQINVSQKDTVTAAASSSAPSINPVSCSSKSQNAEPVFKAPAVTDSNPKSMESNPTTPLTKQLQNSGEEHSDGSNFASFKLASGSPGFTYATRLMYQATAGCSRSDPPQNIPKEVQSSILSQLAFFNRSPRNINITQSPDEDKSEFLASVYEDYLTDSPPEIKGTEKPMFSFADDSPEEEGKNDFFPLFASDNGQTSKDTKSNGAQFMFNFGGSDQPQSPEESRGFKLLF